MRNHSLIFGSAAVIASFLTIHAAAVAQTAPDPPPGLSPVESIKEINGINLTTGKKDFDMPVVLSTPADPRLKFDKVQNAAPYVVGTKVNAGDYFTASYTVNIGGASESFRCTDGDCGSTTGSGSRLPVPGLYTRAPGGEQYHFDLVHLDEINGTHHDLQKYASSVTYPDGERIDFSYSLGYVTNSARTWYRPTQLTSSTGYYITISYQYTGTDASNMLWGTPAEAKLYAPGGQLIRRVTYSTSVTDYGAGDVTGRSYPVTGTNNVLGSQLETSGATLQLPTESSNTMSMSRLAGGYDLVGSINRDGVTWNYAYANLAPNPVALGYNYSTVTVTGPNNYSMTYGISHGGYGDGYRNILSSQTDVLGHTTTYGYDSSTGFRLTDITLPEGNHVHVDYDDCANVITKTSTAKPGSGLANIVESAVYPSNGIPENPCPDVSYYRPTSTTDALGHTTNFSWNTAGQLTQQLDPADGSGVRKETDIAYTVSAGGHSRKTLVRVCGQTTSCAGNAESHTEYTYWGETSLPATVTVKDEATGQTRTTSFTYDPAGRPWIIDGPLPGLDDAQYFQYDIFGRKIWEIGAADPAGKRIARNLFYRDSDDKAYRVNTGIVSCSSCNTEALTFSPLTEQVDYSFDSRRYVIREKRRLSTTDYTVTDKSFLDRGLPECVAVRMNLTALPAVGSHAACSLGAAGSDGNDRITKNNYDNAGQLLKVQRAYGSPRQQDYVSYTYTGNGKQQTVTDANGNKAQYTYDGFDRLTKWAFPSKTVPGTVSTCDYEQYGYDAAGNRTSLRKRDGSTLTYTYDNLNRPISKVGTVGSVTCP